MRKHFREPTDATHSSPGQGGRRRVPRHTGYSSATTCIPARISSAKRERSRFAHTTARAGCACAGHPRPTGIPPTSRSCGASHPSRAVGHMLVRNPPDETQVHPP
jgi:hypothetical protein